MLVELTEDQLKLLYLLYLITKPPGSGPEEKEKWAKEILLLAIICKGARDGIFTYDYAPNLMLFGGAYLITNVSQECLEDLKILALKGLVEILSLATRRHLYIRAYRISERGVELVREALEDEERRKALDEVRRLIACDEHGELMSAHFEERGGEEMVVVLACPHGCRVELRDLFDVEDVSYWSVPVPFWEGVGE